MSITKKDNEYLIQSELWRKVRAVLKGKYAVIDIIDCLPLPQYRTSSILNGMSRAQKLQALKRNEVNATRRLSYWARGRLFNATARTHEALSGMIWSQEPEFVLPSNLERLKTNADGQGSSLRAVAQKITDELVSIGRYGVLADMPAAPVNEQGQRTRLTLAQTESGAFYPKLIKYNAEQIIYARGLEEVRLLETKSVQDEKDEFKWKDETFVRRLIIIKGVYHNQLWNEKKEMIEDLTPVMNGSTMEYIPFQFFGADNNTHEFSKVTLYDLAEINLGHFVLDCDNRDNLHYHGQGMTIVTTSMNSEEFNEANPNGLDVGAKGMNQLNQGDDVKLVQLEATGAIPAEMIRDQERMVSSGAQLVTNNQTAETLGAKRIDSNANTSTLQRISLNISEGMVNLLSWCEGFLGTNSEIEYTLNNKFSTDDLSPQMIQQQMAMVQGGVLPAVTLNETARKVGFTDKDDDQLAEALNDQQLLTGGTSEEQAALQGKLDAALEEIARLKDGS